MITRQFAKRFLTGSIVSAFSLLIICQPFLIGVASAQVVDVSTLQTEGGQIAQADNPQNSLNNIIDDWNQLDWVSQATLPPGTTIDANGKATITNQNFPASQQSYGFLSLDPTDQQALMDCADPAKSCKIDIRVIDYLTNMLTPTWLGGQGIPYLQATILKGYDTTGIGQYDRISTDSNPENPSLPAAEASGQAVDISEVGQVTCKQVAHRRVGSSTTTWQPALPVKVAWQSTAGIATNPTPNGNSLIGVSGAMSAQAITDYLNATGQLDEYIDFVKGLDIGSVTEYIGANILLKDLGSAQITSDPLANDAIITLGANLINKQLQGLPPGLNAANPNNDIRVAAAEAQLENTLGLPNGSLSGGFGWNNLLTTVGKRQIEQVMGLPTHYLDSHSLSDLNGSQVAQAVYSYAKRNDASLNLPDGTIALLQAKDAQGFELAGVNILSSALKLTPIEQQAIVAAVKAKKTPPTVNPTEVQSANMLSANAIAGLLSDSPSAQQVTVSELKQLGLGLFQKALGSAVPSQYTGLTQSVISSLLNPTLQVTVQSVTQSLGLHSLLLSAGVDPNQVATLIANPKSNASALITGTIAGDLNQLFSLNGSSSLNSQDVQGLITGDNSALLKLGGSEMDRGFNWTPGTGLAVAQNKIDLGTAMQQTFVNGISDILGVKGLNLGTTNGLANYGIGILAHQLGVGIDKLRQSSNAKNLASSDKAEFDAQFGITDPNNINFDDPTLNAEWTNKDLAIGAPPGTTKAYLHGDIDTATYAQLAQTGSIDNMTADQLNSQFGTTDPAYQLPSQDPNNKQVSPLDQIKQYAKDAAHMTDAQKNAALGWVNALLSYGVDAQAHFSPGDFATVFNAKTVGSNQATALIDTGLKLFVRAIGGNISNLSDDQINNVYQSLKQLFNDPNSVAQLESRREQYDALGLKIMNGTATPDDIALYNALATNTQLAGWANIVNTVTGYFLQASGIPAQYQLDVTAFIHGDWQDGLAAMGYVQFAQQFNQYLPADDQITYAELRATIGLVDPAVVNQGVNSAIAAAGNSSGVNPTNRADLAKQVRQTIINQTSQNIQYQVADSFLRKADPNIPAGFSKAMFTGTDAERALMLENFGFNAIDQVVKKADPAYIPGTLEALITGHNLTGQSLSDLQKQALTLPSLIAQLPISLGPLTAGDISNIVKYAAASTTDRQTDLTNPQFATTFATFDRWLAGSIGISNLPAGLSRSILLASQHNFDFNYSLKDSNGNVIVPSIDLLAKGWLTSQIGSWADKELRLPVGSVYRVYTAIQSVVNASTALQGAQIATYLTGDEAAATAARASLSKAQANLALVVITTALAVCLACQQFFASIDQALGAPAGFTNQLATAAIAFALNIPAAGWTALAVAAAMYLFGVSSVSYDCPTPPTDQYALTAYDPSNDQLGFGYNPDSGGPINISSAPSPGQNPFDWQHQGIDANGNQVDVPFSTGNNQQLWEGWARYWTGYLLQATMNYGESQDVINKPLQVVTYRQANVEYFADQAVATFGPNEPDSQNLGMGFTQTSTKVVGQVHVSFGGLY